MKKWFLLLSVLLVLVILLPAQPHAVAAVEPTLSVVPDKTVTLTFDDGPDPRFTPEILDMLKKRHLQATFFIVGRNAMEQPDLVRRMQREGHTIANHTLTHPHLELMTSGQVTAELQGGDAALTSVLGPAFPVPHFFRPPRGNVSQAILDTTVSMDKQLILWNVCVENHTTPTPAQVEARVMDLIHQRNGGILLAHDGELDRSLTVRSLPRILDDLLQEGYHIVPLQKYLDQQHTKKARESLAFYYQESGEEASFFYENAYRQRPRGRRPIDFDDGVPNAPVSLPITNPTARPITSQSRAAAIERVLTAWVAQLPSSTVRSNNSGANTSHG